MRSRQNSNLSDGAKLGGGSSSPAVRQALIDKEQGPVPDMGPDGVQLKWTKLGVPSPAKYERTRTLSGQRKVGASSNGSSSASSAENSPRGRPPPSPRPENERPTLPPDAVDLIVEDPHAAQAESSYDRRKGEPTALHRVYRRGYVIDEEGDRQEGEVEVEDESGPFTVGDDVDTVVDAEDTAVDEMAVTRAATPPAHARVVDHYKVPSEENPWA